MKRILFFLALPLAISVFTAEPSAHAAANSAASAGAPLKVGGELQYERDMAKHLHEELNLHGSNRRVRSQIKQADAEIFRVNDEIKARHYDAVRLHSEVARIDDLLHSIDYELRDLMVHEPSTLTGGKESLVH